MGKPEEAGASGIALARSLRHIEEELAAALPPSRCVSLLLLLWNVAYRRAKKAFVEMPVKNVFAWNLFDGVRLSMRDLCLIRCPAL